MNNKKFLLLSDTEKSKYVNSGQGGRLTKLQSEFKTKEWPIMVAIKAGRMPYDTLGQLAYNYFK